MPMRRDDDGDDFVLWWLLAIVLMMFALEGCASNPMPIIKERIVPCPIALPVDHCPDEAPAPETDGETLYTFYKRHLETWKAYQGCKLTVDAIKELHGDCEERTDG